MQVAPSSAARRGRCANQSSGAELSLRRQLAAAGSESLDGRVGSLLRQPDEAQAELLVLAGLRASTAPRASGRCPDCVLGKAMTSRMFVWWASRAAQRSMPRAIPPCGGAP